MTILFSILILSLTKRKLYLDRLMNILSPQLTDEVEVLLEIDNGEKTIGEKRNNLLERSKGRYIAFIDDDDVVESFYVKEILDAINKNPDVVGLSLIFKVDNVLRGKALHSIKYDHWWEEFDGELYRYFRNPNHLNPVKREFALMTKFPSINYKEDRDYSKRIYEFLKTEVMIERPIYQYLYRTTKTEETPSVETPSVETSSVETSSVETSSVETSSVETSSVETSSVETSSVAFLIPMTSRGREWSSFEDTYLYNYFIKSLSETNGYSYTLYLGIDSDDIFCLSETFIDGLRRSIAFPFKIIKFEGIEKGHVTKMWNILFETAYSDGCQYFVQCGDDVAFIDQDWLGSCITALKNNNDVGVAGPVDINTCTLFLTQSVVSRKHMEIFGYYFPVEIKNWYCDNWINDVYKSVGMLFIADRRCRNSGGKERYEVVREGKSVLESIIKPSEEKLKKYIFCSQCLQDRFLEESVFKGYRNGIFVNIGAYDGVSIDNTLYFEKYRNWTGINIEPIKEIFNKLEKNRPNCTNINCAVSNTNGTSNFILSKGVEMLSGLVSSYDDRHRKRMIFETGGEYQIIEVQTRTLESICEEHNINEINYLSIDVEGAEFDVIKSIDFRKIKIDVIDFENNFLDASMPIIKYLEEKNFQVVMIADDIFMINKSSKFYLKDKN